ncbi:hypothetical protein D9Q98_000833 [Chlorella vulgaris]|uniref:RING-type domain-containing protein n=1 Tax=Chlorella vulgaris TaxID=3077 RepID=A0A9D4Z2N9_CHLVU|nr:hypothetical protein D9Q98_000833 [Chlorella vulgaris]
MAAQATTTAANSHDVVDLLSDSEDTPAQHAASGQDVGPPRRRAAAASRRGQQQQQQRRQPGPRVAAGSSDVIDLTVEPVGGLQVVRSTLQRVPMRGTKRPRARQPAEAAVQLSPGKQLLHQLRNPPPPPPPEAEQEGPKCGICMEAMGGSHARQMASGNCGHVYCYDCLVAAVRTQKKCPTCRKNMQQRQIHKVFLSFT